MQNESGGDEFGISDAEKQQLLNEVKKYKGKDDK